MLTGDSLMQATNEMMLGLAKHFDNGFQLSFSLYMYINFIPQIKFLLSLDSDLHCN